MQRRLGASFVFLSLGLVALVQAPGPHPPDQGHHDQRCVDAFECHCDPHAPDNMPVCEGGHCSCHHVHLCAHNHECHCDPPSPDKIPTCTDGQCTCQHTGILDADRCTHDDECHHHCEPPGPDHKPVCMDGHCSCHHTEMCTHKEECHHIHCEPPDHEPACTNGQCSCHHAGRCIHNGECHCDSPNNNPVCIDGQCSCLSIAQTTCYDNSECVGSHCTTQGLYPFCRTSLANGQSYCDCTACTDDNHCASKCGSGTSPKCNTSLAHDNICYCENIVSATQTSCHDNSDCFVSHCTIPGLHPFCRTSLANGQSYCDCTACTEDHHCASKCGSGATPKCSFSSVNGYSCSCENTMSTSTMTSTPTVSTSRLTNTKGSTTPVSQTSIRQGSSSDSTPTSANTSGKVTTVNTQTSTQTLPPSNSLSSNLTYVTVTGSDSTTSTTETTTTTNSITTVPTRAIPRRCHVCGSTTSASLCDTRTIYLGNLQTCPSGSDFCMTDIIHGAGGSVQIFKRCVTEIECKDKWLHQSSDLDYCTDYGNVLGQGHYSCHFCCTEDGCNSKLVPQKSTWYTKS
nr:teneurin-3 isoform X1 [Crassostrea gigas]XP_034336684.1 teneurin-3 isoform X1 [Crassostrea gigas]XP_034336690.1 teneurin-3 isoform X1 [Crassostrea gigas]